MEQMALDSIRLVEQQAAQMAALQADTAQLAGLDSLGKAQLLQNKLRDKYGVFAAAAEGSEQIFSLSANGRLTIQIEDTYERQGNLPTLTVYSSTLDEVENSSDSTLRISGLPRLKSFKARLVDNGKIIVRDIFASQLELQILSGKGKIIASGGCDDLSLRLVGTGEVQADNVEATTVSCRIMGTGTIGCNVNGGELKVSGSGTGKVYYKGNPSKVTVRKLGTIKAIPME